jgi:hypothetical protein
MTTLREARKQGKLDQFIKEHEEDAPGDREKLDKAIKRPASQKSKEAPKASSRRGSGD